MIVELTRVQYGTGRHGAGSLERVLVNTDYIVYIKPTAPPELVESVRSTLHKDVQFSRLVLDHSSHMSDITVVGSPESLASKISMARTQLLKG